jgi:hypothetical protein
MLQPSRDRTSQQHRLLAGSRQVIVGAAAEHTYVLGAILATSVGG